MTLLDQPTTTALVPVAFDLYKDIHKAIRVELFSATTEAARLDPGAELDRAALAAQVRDVVGFLVDHAEHEDGAIQPVLERELPDLAERVERDHHHLESWMEDLVSMAEEAVVAPASGARFAVHRLHLELASFTSAYLAHQDVEERVIMPALEAAVGVPAVVEIHQAILAGIAPEDMARSLSLMFPAMNIDDRTDLLRGMMAGAPPEVFQGVWGLVCSVLPPADLEPLAARLGV